MIRKEGKSFVLRTKDGSKILGKHPTKEKALKQERAIKIAEGRAYESTRG